MKLTVAEAATDAGTTQRTIRRWIADGRLTAKRVNGRVHVDLADLNRVEAATRRHGGKPRLWQKQRSLS